MDAAVEKIEYTPVASAVIPAPKKSYLVLKRAFDVAASLGALLLLSPVFLVVAVLIKLDSPGPVIHKRRCEGKDGAYAMLKFRTMVADADDLEKYLTPEQIEEYRKNIKLKDDPRITKLGKTLRKASIDELPQFINVIKGEMSIVGPRPVVAEELPLYGEAAEEILSVKPGITGYWQTHGRGDCTYESGDRQEKELYYVRHRSLWLDTKIFFRTFAVVARRGGAR